ncbi:hypothetical protein QUF50_06490, partial [Thiotrichales bacterium HSG1]|nr:hypothetical protein [Thiotrichales bacterium HSG1]
MFIGYMLPFKLAPVAINFYHDYRDSIASLHQNIELYEKLAERAEYWEKENKYAKQKLDKVKSGTLPGTNYELIRTKIQSLVRQLASSAGVTFKSLVVPDSVQIDEWI